MYIAFISFTYNILVKSDNNDHWGIEKNKGFKTKAPAHMSRCFLLFFFHQVNQVFPEFFPQIFPPEGKSYIAFLQFKSQNVI